MVAKKEGQLTNDDGNNGSTNCCRTKQGLTRKKNMAYSITLLTKNPMMSTLAYKYM